MWLISHQDRSSDIWSFEICLGWVRSPHTPRRTRQEKHRAVNKKSLIGETGPLPIGGGLCFGEAADLRRGSKPDFCVLMPIFPAD